MGENLNLGLVYNPSFRVDLKKSANWALKMVIFYALVLILLTKFVPK